jgi:mannose-6-phosphate isomerase-like protein (cupin superfamily)
MSPDGRLERDDQPGDQSVAGTEQHPARPDALCGPRIVPYRHAVVVTGRPEQQHLVGRRLRRIGRCDRLETKERPSWPTFEGHLRVGGERCKHRLEISRAHTQVETLDVSLKHTSIHAWNRSVRSVPMPRCSLAPVFSDLAQARPEPVDARPKTEQLHAREAIVVLEGSARITIENGPTLDLDVGDIASIPKGAVTTWHPSADFKEIGSTPKGPATLLFACASVQEWSPMPARGLVPVRARIASTVCVLASA